MRFLLKLAAVTAVIAFSPRVTPDIRVDSVGSALGAAIVYGLLVVLIGWLVRLFVAFVSIVPGILTFGLFFLLVPMIANAVLLKMTSGLLASFEVTTWTAAFGLSFVLGVVGALFERKNKDKDDD